MKRNVRLMALSGLLVTASLATSSGSSILWAQADGGLQPVREKVTPAFQYPLENVPGKTVTGLIVEYPPAGATPAHRHGTAFIVGYVLEGEIRSQLDGGEIRVFKAGESWTESPGAHHTLSANASTTQPARLLAILIADTGDANLLVFD